MEFLHELALWWPSCCYHKLSSWSYWSRHNCKLWRHHPQLVQQHETWISCQLCQVTTWICYWSSVSSKPCLDFVLPHGLFECRFESLHLVKDLKTSIWCWSHWIVAQCILQTTKNLAQKVINSFIVLLIMHFESKNVIKCIFMLCNVLKFCCYREMETFSLHTTIVILYDVFLALPSLPFATLCNKCRTLSVKT